MQHASKDELSGPRFQLAFQESSPVAPQAAQTISSQAVRELHGEGKVLVGVFSADC